MDQETLKERAAAEALEEVRSGMRLGLGTGSTIAHFLRLLAAAQDRGDLLGVAGVPTSERTAESCRELGIPTLSLSDHPELDLAIDGADEVSPTLDLIKGLGGALLREKMVACAAGRVVIIADESKLVRRLGEKSPLPVEVVRFEWRFHLGFLTDLGARPELRRGTDGEPVITDNGNFILDCRFPDGIEDPAQVDRQLLARPGIVDHGLFLGMTDLACIATAQGVRRLER